MISHSLQRIRLSLSRLIQYRRYRERIYKYSRNQARSNDHSTYHHSTNTSPNIILLISSNSWHQSLIDAFRDVILSDYIHLDYTTLKITPQQLQLPKSSKVRRSIESEILSVLSQSRRNVIIGYFDGYLVSPGFLSHIRQHYDVVISNISYDDRQSWDLWVHDDIPYRNLADITSLVDFYFTSSRDTLCWHIAEGGNPIFLPEGGDISLFERVLPNPRSPITFIGEKYGIRAELVSFLLSLGYPIEAYGRGWPNGFVSAQQIPKILRRTSILLGSNTVSSMHHITTLKARDYDYTLTGIPYVTSYTPDLATSFHIGQDVWCYGDLLEIPTLFSHIYQNYASITSHLSEKSLEYATINSWQARARTILQYMRIEHS